MKMCKFVNNTKHSRIDKCMKIFMHNLEVLSKESYKILACCCGHGKYPMTIIVDGGLAVGGCPIFEMFSGKIIKRKKSFYKKDKQGMYYIPEVVENGINRK